MFIANQALDKIIHDDILLVIRGTGPMGMLLLKGLCHGQKCLHLFSDSEAYHEQMAQYPAQMEA